MLADTASTCGHVVEVDQRNPDLKSRHAIEVAFGVFSDSGSFVRARHLRCLAEAVCTVSANFAGFPRFPVADAAIESVESGRNCICISGKTACGKVGVIFGLKKFKRPFTWRFTGRYSFG